MLHSLRLWGAVPALLLVCALVGAQERKPFERFPAEKDPANDQEFLVRGLAHEVAEVKFAEQTARKASNEEVKQFATRMAQDHGKLRAGFLDRAKAMKIAVVEGFEKHHKDTAERLSKMEGLAFDREYLDIVIDTHEQSIKLYETWSKNAKDEGLRNIAAQGLTMCKAHLEEAKKLKEKLKGQ